MAILDTNRRAQQVVDENAVVEAALEYASRGWKVINVYGPRPDGKCSCVKGDRCPSPCKHPVGNQWEVRATSDPAKIRSWWQRMPGANVGIKLGPDSGIVDFECDSPAAEAAFVELFRHEPPATPTYSARRGKHRLFQWRSDLPAAIGVIKVNGVECRLGAGDRGIQSAAPPSRHASGVTYAWLPGCSPADIEPPPIPDHVVQALHEAARGGGGKIGSNGTGKPHRTRAQWRQILEGIPEGGNAVAEGRNAAAAALVGRMLRAFKDPLSIQDTGLAWDVLVGWNKKNQPPLTRDELEVTFESILRTEQERRQTEDVLELCPPSETVAEPATQSIPPSPPAPSSANQDQGNPKDQDQSKKDADQDQGKKKSPLEALQKKLSNIGITKVKRHGTKRDGLYDLIIGAGDNETTVELGTGDAVLSFAKTRSAIFKATGKVLKKDRAKDWDIIASLIHQAAQGESVENDRESDTLSMVAGFVDGTFRERNNHHKFKLSDPAEKLRALIALDTWEVGGDVQPCGGKLWDLDDGSLLIALRPLNSWLSESGHGARGTSDLAMRLKRLGFVAEQLEARDGDTVRNKRLWRSPPKFFAVVSRV